QSHLAHPTLPPFPTRRSSDLGEESVYDLTEPVTHHFVANGIVVHNCSEYMFLDDTACNLASLNLIKFYDLKTQKFDVESFRQATDRKSTRLNSSHEWISYAVF